MTTLQIVSLEYLIAVYPLFLTALTYVLIELHDRDCRVLILMLRPFHRCFTRFRKQWNPKGTIIHAFASFLLLSYVKIAAVSFTLLRYTEILVYEKYDERVYSTALYIDPSVHLFSAQHAPYAVLSFLMLLIFTLLPLIILALYPLRLIQLCFNALHIKAHFVREVIYSLQGCYKDGTGSEGSRDFRCFAAAFLFLRILCAGGMFIIPHFRGELAAIFIILVLGFTAAYLKPYRNNWCNVWSTLVLATIASILFAEATTHLYKDLLIALNCNILSCLPVAYMSVLVVAVAFKRVRFVQKLKYVYKKVVRSDICTSVIDQEESLPYRLLDHNSMQVTHPMNTEHNLNETSQL